MMKNRNSLAVIQIVHPPIEGRPASGFEGMDVGQGLRVQLVSTNLERGYP